MTINSLVVTREFIFIEFIAVRYWRFQPRKIV